MIKEIYLSNFPGVSPKRLLSPLYLVGDLPQGGEESAPDDKTPIPEPSPDSDAQKPPTVSSSMSGGTVPAVTSSQSVPISSGNTTAEELLPPVSSLDEFIWEGLVDPDEVIPENTEIVYHSAKSTDESEDASSPLASVALIFAGMLLFVSTICVGIIFRQREKQEKRSEKTSK